MILDPDRRSWDDRCCSGILRCSARAWTSLAGSAWQCFAWFICDFSVEDVSPKVGDPWFIQTKTSPKHHSMMYLCVSYGTALGFLGSPPREFDGLILSCHAVAPGENSTAVPRCEANHEVLDEGHGMTGMTGMTGMIFLKLSKFRHVSPRTCNPV